MSSDGLNRVSGLPRVNGAVRLGIRLWIEIACGHPLRAVKAVRVVSDFVPIQRLVSQ